MDDESLNDSAPEGAVQDKAPEKTLTPAAQRALAEAQARREAAQTQALPPEEGGRGGLEPTRFGDWERRGLATDF
jgi:hypothetical protein